VVSSAPPAGGRSVKLYSEREQIPTDARDIIDATERCLKAGPYVLETDRARADVVLRCLDPGSRANSQIRVREQEASGSNPLAPTNSFNKLTDDAAANPGIQAIRKGCTMIKERTRNGNELGYRSKALGTSENYGATRPQKRSAAICGSPEGMIWQL
jgi:hypothetical protein